jgi:hypothetical protein
VAFRGALEIDAHNTPDDAELLLLSAALARDGDPGAAEGLYCKLVGRSEGRHFVSLDTGLRAVKGRHNSTAMLLEQNQLS